MGPESFTRLYLVETGGAPAEEEGAGEQQGSADFEVGVDGHVSKAAVTLHKPGLVRPGGRVSETDAVRGHCRCRATERMPVLISGRHDEEERPQQFQKRTKFY